MAFRKRSSRRSSRRKASRRKMPMRRSMRSRYGQGKIYAYKRTCELHPYHFSNGNWVRQAANFVTNDVGNLGYNNGIFKFKLEDLPGFTDFTNLYENFKITGVKLRFIPTMGTSSDAVDANTTIMEPLALCIDRGANDNIAFNPTFSALLENQDVKIRSSYKPFSLYIAYPKAHTPADGVTQTVLTSPWLDTEVNGQVVDHHGLKFDFQAAVPTTRSVWFRVYATYYLKCRAPQ